MHFLNDSLWNNNQEALRPHYHIVLSHCAKANVPFASVIGDSRDVCDSVEAISIAIRTSSICVKYRQDKADVVEGKGADGYLNTHR